MEKCCLRRVGILFSIQNRCAIQLVKLFVLIGKNKNALNRNGGFHSKIASILIVTLTFHAACIHSCFPGQLIDWPDIRTRPQNHDCTGRSNRDIWSPCVYSACLKYWKNQASVVFSVKTQLSCICNKTIPIIWCFVHNVSVERVLKKRF